MTYTYGDDCSKICLPGEYYSTESVDCETSCITGYYPNTYDNSCI